ncbi:MAG: hypothetical protein LC624_02395 [Halobacteriales archaeon]|nr:hypothetical protein [Halobacteriales archaeon]
MGKTEHALDIMHEAGILCCMLLFVVSGAMLMLRYANDGDALPIFGGFAAMGIGAATLLRTPGRFRKWHGMWDRRRAGEPAAEVEDENALYDEEIVRVRGG